MQAIEQTRTWCWRFDAADLNNSKMVVDLVDSICVECGVDLSRRADLELVMTEVINNAIDHGVLGLDSAMKKSPEGFEQYFMSRAARLADLRQGYIAVSVDQVNDHLISVSVEDSGRGFNFSSNKQLIGSHAISLNSFGRGLLIIKHLCHSMTHLGSGNCILLQFNITSNNNAAA